MTYQITVLESAWDDLKALLEFYNARSHDPVLLESLTEYVIDYIETLASFPERHVVVFYQGDAPVYQMVLSRFPLLIYYSIDFTHRTVVVAQIRHAKENPQIIRSLLAIDQK